MYPEKKGGSHKMARPQQNWGLLTLLTRWASIWTMPNTASPKSEPPCGRAVYTPVRVTILGHPPQKTAPGGWHRVRYADVSRWLTLGQHWCRWVLLSFHAFVCPSNHPWAWVCVLHTKRLEEMAYNLACWCIQMAYTQHSWMLMDIVVGLSVRPFDRLRHFQVAVHLLTNHLEQMA